MRSLFTCKIWTTVYPQNLQFIIMLSSFFEVKLWASVKYTHYYSACVRRKNEKKGEVWAHNWLLTFKDFRCGWSDMAKSQMSCSSNSAGFQVYQKDWVIIDWHCVWSKLAVILFSLHSITSPAHLPPGEKTMQSPVCKCWQWHVMKLGVCFWEMFKFLRLTTLIFVDSTCHCVPETSPGIQYLYACISWWSSGAARRFWLKKRHAVGDQKVWRSWENF